MNYDANKLMAKKNEIGPQEIYVFRFERSLEVTRFIRFHFDSKILNRCKLSEAIRFRYVRSIPGNARTIFLSY